MKKLTPESAKLCTVTMLPISYDAIDIRVVCGTHEIKLTFCNRQKGNQSDASTVSATDIVVEISD
jgi:hypothetical protein